MLAPTFSYNLHGCVIQASAGHETIEVWKDEKLIETINGNVSNLPEAVGIARYGSGKKLQAAASEPEIPTPTVGEIVNDIVGETEKP